MDSDLSIDEIVMSLHNSLEETLKISLGPFVDKFNSSRNQFNVVTDLLKQLPEYKNIIKHNALLTEENRILKEYIRKQSTKNHDENRIKLEIIEKEISEISADEKANKVKKQNEGMSNISGEFNANKMWSLKKQLFPKLREPMAKKDDKGNIITSPEGLKSLYINTYDDRLGEKEKSDDFKELKLLKNCFVKRGWN